MSDRSTWHFRKVWITIALPKHFPQDRIRFSTRTAATISIYVLVGDSCVGFFQLPRVATLLIYLRGNPLTNQTAPTTILKLSPHRCDYVYTDRQILIFFLISSFKPSPFLFLPCLLIQKRNNMDELLVYN